MADNATPNPLPLPTPGELIQRCPTPGSLGRLGCAETQWAAYAIVKWLSENGDVWNTPFDLEQPDPHDKHCGWTRMLLHYHTSMDDAKPDYLCSILRLLIPMHDDTQRWRVSNEFIQRVQLS